MRLGRLRGLKKHFETLDGLRGVAASVVLVGHATGLFCESSIVPHKNPAVLFFFMLSGFVISYAYGAKLLEGMPIASFYQRRAIRLYPLIVLGSILGWLAIPTTTFKLFGLGHLTLSMLVLPNPASVYPYYLNPPEWSLFFELIGCLLFPFLIRMRTSFLAAISIICAVANIYTFKDAAWPLSALSLAISFNIGILLWRNRIKFPPIPFWVLALIVVATCIAPLPLSAVYDIAITLLVFPIIIGAGLGHSRAAILLFLGNISYPLYILHWPVLQFVRLNFGNSTASMLAAIVLSYALAWTALLFFDLPVRRFLTQLSGVRLLKPYMVRTPDA
jgi:peptidoglycan/LPS O-acetylase OafA/YrhL